MDTLNSKLTTDQSLTALVTPETFLSMDPNLQKKIIDTAAQENADRGGIIGKFFGTDSTRRCLKMICRNQKRQRLFWAIYSYKGVENFLK